MKVIRGSFLADNMLAVSSNCMAKIQHIKANLVFFPFFGFPAYVAWSLTWADRKGFTDCAEAKKKKRPRKHTRRFTSGSLDDTG